MVQVTWTVQAFDDLQALSEYIAQDSPRYAALFTDRLVDASARLATFPQAGRVVPEFERPDVRELLVGDYRLIYRLRPGLAEVLAIHHGARTLRLSIEDEQP